MKRVSFPSSAESVDNILARSNSGEDLKGSDKQALRNYLQGSEGGKGSSEYTTQVAERIKKIREALNLRSFINASLAVNFETPELIESEEDLENCESLGKAYERIAEILNTDQMKRKHFTAEEVRQHLSLDDRIFQIITSTGESIRAVKIKIGINIHYPSANPKKLYRKDSNDQGISQPRVDLFIESNDGATFVKEVKVNSSHPDQLISFNRAKITRSIKREDSKQFLSGIFIENKRYSWEEMIGLLASLFKTSDETIVDVIINQRSSNGSNYRRDDDNNYSEILRSAATRKDGFTIHRISSDTIGFSWSNNSDASFFGVIGIENDRITFVMLS